MVKLPDNTPSRKDQIKFLMERKFGPGGEVSAGEIAEIRARQVAGNTLTLADLTNLPEEFSKFLSQKSNEDLRGSYYAALEIKSQIDDAALAAEKAKLDAEARQRHDRLRNLPRSKADLDYWSKQAFWEIDDAVAVSLDLDPRVVSWRVAERELYGSALAHEFRDRPTLAARARQKNQLPYQASPAIWLTWFNERELNIPKGLSELIEARSHLYGPPQQQIDAFSKATEEAQRRIAELEHQLADAKKDVSGKAKSSLLKIILGLAIADLGYDPTAGKSPIPQEIADLLASVGIEIEADTVRKYLNEAASEVEYASNKGV